MFANFPRVLELMYKVKTCLMQSNRVVVDGENEQDDSRKAYRHEKGRLTGMRNIHPAGQ